jgi:excisionase family DNA binding protein
LTVDQAAKLLNISRAKLYQMIQREEFPAVRMGSAVRVRPQDLQQFIDGNTV